MNNFVKFMFLEKFYLWVLGFDEKCGCRQDETLALMIFI